MNELSSPATLPPRPKTLQARAARFLRLALKELRETLRDRRTIVTLVLMPVLVYPVLGIALQQFVLSGASQSGDLTWRIAAESEADLRLLERMLADGNQLIEQDRGMPQLPPATETAAVVPLPGPKSDFGDAPTIEMFESSDLVQRLHDLDIDLGVRLRNPPSRSGEWNEPLEFELIYRANMPLSRQVAEHVATRLRAFNEGRLREQVRSSGESVAPDVVWRWEPVYEQSQSPFPLAALAPMVLILMTITGAVYPAIDLTAGERERGTLEALMAAPVPRLYLLGAKYVAVLSVALLTAIANLAAMTITLRGTGLGAALLGPQGMSLTVIGLIFLLLGLFAAFFSAVLLAITSFARSFKEAQAYLIPLILLSLGPGFLSVMPGLKLNGLLAVVPLANIVLLARDVIQGAAEPLPATVAVLATALYAIAALAVAARIFGSDAVLYGSQGSWSDAFRRPEQPLPVATLSGAWLTAALLYPLYFWAMGVLGAYKHAPPLVQIALAAAGTVAIFAIVPWIVAQRQRVSTLSGFQLRPPRWLAIVGAVLLGCSLWPLAHELFLLVQLLGLGSISEDQLNRMVPQVNEMLEGWRRLSPVVILVAFALLPASCEEFFFRGYLLGAMRDRLPAWLAIGATGLLFGVFHLSVGGLAAVERVVTSTFLGLVLGWVCWRTRSVWPGVLTHTLHNGILLSLAYWKDKLPGAEIAATSGHLPPAWLAAAGLGAAVGLALIYLGGRSASDRNTDSSTNTPARDS